MRRSFLLSLLGLVLWAAAAGATSNHDYGADEYDTICQGTSPNGKYAITTHGGGKLGYDNFHIYLTDAVAGKKIGPLEEIAGTLDTGASAFCARWSTDSQFVTIIYRIDRHEPLKAVTYRIGKGRAFPLQGPGSATQEQTKYWGVQCANSQSNEKIFGTTKAQ